MFNFFLLSALNKIPIPNRNTEVRQQLMFRKLGHMMSIYIFRYTQQGQTWHLFLMELLLRMYSKYACLILTPLSRGRTIKKDLMRSLNFSNMKISWILLNIVCVCFASAHKEDLQNEGHNSRAGWRERKPKILFFSIAMIVLTEII